MSDFLTGLALVLVIEGVVWSLFPETMRQAAEYARALDTGMLRAGGLFMAALGVVGVWLVRG